jgi:hypothetical protein
MKVHICSTTHESGFDVEALKTACPQLAVHNTMNVHEDGSLYQDKTWTITHIPTGFFLMKVDIRYKGWALKACEKLAEIPEQEWKQLTTENVVAFLSEHADIVAQARNIVYYGVRNDKA